MSTLNLFPVRVAIGNYTETDDEGKVTVHEVFASDEFYRALTALFKRVGGPNGIDIASLELLTAFAPQPDITAVEALNSIRVMDAFSASPALPATPDISIAPDQTARAAELEKRLADMDLKMEAAGALVAQAAELAKRLDAAALRLEMNPQPQETAELSKTVMALQIEAAFAPPAPDWEHPGQIGAKTANTGAFTSLSATGHVTFEGVTSTGATGTGKLVFDTSPTLSGKLTFNDVTGDKIQFNGTAANSYKISKANALAGGDGLFSLTSGATSAGEFGFYCGGTLGLFIGSGGALTAYGGFGCNGATAQTAYPSGGALAAYGAGANGFDTAGHASALHALVVSIRAALVANGIMS